ncbi:universal stress protein [Modestobacter marinus]|uniref:Nucleotide-binding universal stress UspA family protein n=1 Tax=Modestobacter marinus TaxID=477641 RepID=A0A846LTG8_9ACTN|nr:universal stress protein [Modestobacter marinus]NIH68925.1 nucleotide-binding universal stress UspA family protein [Modestobacter marinus]GGL78870.1 universal stress protein [Modestobacter marinus]
MGEATERSGRSGATEGAGRPRVVVGVDGSAVSQEALGWALAAAGRRGAVLEVVSTYPIDIWWADAYLTDRTWVETVRVDAEARTRALVEEALRGSVTGGTVPVKVVVVPGAPAEHLVRLSAGADLLVVGSRGRGAVRSTLLGSVALHCSTRASCPVVVVHPQEPAGHARVVVGLDGSAASRAALAHAATMAAELGAEVEGVAAWRLPTYWSDVSVMLLDSATEIRDAAERRAQEMVTAVLGPEPRVPVSIVAVEGPAGDALVQRAAGAALLVVGSRSRSRLPGVLLGSIALHCVVHAPCPVMVVHPGAPADAPHPEAELADAGS